MPAAAWMTLVVAALIIAFTALGLLRVIFHLRHVRQTLAAVTGGVQSSPSGPATVPVVLPSVNANLKPVRDFCERSEAAMTDAQLTAHHLVAAAGHYSTTGWWIGCDHRHRHRAGRGGAGRADPAAGPVDRQGGGADQRRADRGGAQHRPAGRAAHHDRARHDHHRRPGRAAAPGWEAEPWLCRTHRSR